jgi:N-acetyl-anhydromuramyl-L-alanine amidase AmpD
MKNTIVYHHTGNPAQKFQTDSVIAQHLRESKIRQAGAYHYIIEFDGTIVQLHNEDFIGNHAGNWAVNLISIAICLAGDFTKMKPNEAQLKSMTNLTLSLQTRWGIPDSNIKLHREVRLNPTACPGTDLRALYIERRQKGKEMKIVQLQHAEKRAKGQRLLLIQRTLARLLAPFNS